MLCLTLSTYDFLFDDVMWCRNDEIMLHFYTDTTTYTMRSNSTYVITWHKDFIGIQY